MRAYRRGLVPFTVLVATSCAPPPHEPRPTTAVVDPGSTDFWALPMPSDLRRTEDGTFGLLRWPDTSESDIILMWLRAADARLDGWGLSQRHLHAHDGRAR